MREISDLGQYVHSYSKYLFLWDLNKRKYVKLSNESINENYVYRDRCIYCVFDYRYHRGREIISPRCDADITTRSRFFKHLQNLEIELNRRLICFEDELESFKIKDYLDNRMETKNNQLICDPQHTIEFNDNQTITLSKDAYLKNRFNDFDRVFLNSAISFCSSNSGDFDRESNHLSEPIQNSNGSIYSNYFENEFKNSNFNSNTPSDSPLSFSPPMPSPERSNKPIIKSILEIEKESKKNKKFQSNFLEHVIIINQIIGENNTKFLCYLNEI